jgi:hypothetical protein
MENINKESKSLLAKLLATEDISVVHKKMPSAYFDTKNRELGLPILKNMNGDIYDLMTLHEVGHALWTDNDEWMAIVKNENDDDLPKSFINVTEDVRIERKIKSKYPGGVRSFVKGYTNLYRDNFFGTGGKELNEMNLADKINLHAKIGMITGITFNEEETVIYDMCKDAVTFADAIEAARVLYDYCKEHNQMPEDNDDHDMMGSSDSEDYEWGETEKMEASDEKSDDKSEGDSNEKSDEKSEGDSEKSESSESTEDGSEGNPSESNPENRTGGYANGLGTLTNDIQAETVLDWEDNKTDLNDIETSDYFYKNIPESNLDSIIDYKENIAHLKEYYEDTVFCDVRRWNRLEDDNKQVEYTTAWIDAAYKYASKLEKDSMRTVNYLLKEFEMKKSADSYQRTSTAKTGILDMLKMHSYKYNDDIFKKIEIKPGEKNHGLVIFLDWSASMSKQHHECFKQLLQIVWFCRRAGIKFEVYAFSDAGWGISDKFAEFKRSSQQDLKQSPTWKFKNRDMACSDHLLLNLFSNRMTKAEQKKMTHYLTMTTFAISADYSRYGSSPINEITKLISPKFEHEIKYSAFIEPAHAWRLGGTPLNGAIINAMNFIPKYRTKNGIQKLNVVFITDGDSNDNGRDRVCNIGLDNDPDDPYEHNRESGSYKDTVVFHDPITKKSYNKSSRSGRSNNNTTSTLLTMLKDRTKCNVVGFFLADTTINNRVHNRDLMEKFPNQDLKELRKTLKSDKVLVCATAGYDEYYFIPGGKNLEFDDGELEVTGDMTRGKMAKGFTSYMRGKTVNRVLLNKFVEQIA